MFSYQLSLRKRQEMKFSRTEWGLGKSQDNQMSHSVMWFSFCFLSYKATAFPPSQPHASLSVSCFFDWAKCLCSVCNLCVVVKLSINAVAFLCGRQMAFSTCENIHTLHHSKKEVCYFLLTLCHSLLTKKGLTSGYCPQRTICWFLDLSRVHHPLTAKKKCSHINFNGIRVILLDCN